MTRTDMANKYAADAADAADNGDHSTKVFASASSAMMGRREAYLKAHALACDAMTWCDMRRIEYTDADDAIRQYRAGIVAHDL